MRKPVSLSTTNRSAPPNASSTKPSKPAKTAAKVVKEQQPIQPSEPIQPSVASSRTLGSAFTSASYLIGLQVFSRILTSSLNILSTRFVGPSIFGAATVQLHVLSTSILFLSREGFRRACIRDGSSARDDIPFYERREAARRLVDLVWIAVLAAIPITIIACALFLFPGTVDDNTTTLEHMTASIMIVGVASIAEMIGEPAYVLIQSHLLIKARVAIEGLALLFKCLVTFLLVTRTSSFGLLSFAFAHLAFGIVSAIGHWVYCSRHVKQNQIQVSSSSTPSPSLLPLLHITDLLPRPRRIVFYFFDKTSTTHQTLRLAGGFSMQSIGKYVLTEGEKLVLMSVGSLTDQGVYGLVNNLGSLVARFLLQPVEETSFSVFSKVRAEAVAIMSSPSSTAAIQSKALKESNATLSRVLSLLIKMSVMIGLFFVCFGPHLSFSAIDILFQSKWSQDTDAPKVLSAFCFFIFSMSLNGITEAFVHAVSDENQLKRLNMMMVVFSLVYMAAAYFFIQTLSTVGLVLANTISGLPTSILLPCRRYDIFAFS